MKKSFFILFVVMFLTVSLVSAGGGHKDDDDRPGIGNIDKECQANGFDYGIAKFENKDGKYKLDEGITSPYDVTVLENSNNQVVYWSANPGVAGVLLKTKKDYYVTGLGGVSGEVSMNIKNDISHATFCGNYDDQEVPEFGVIASLAVLGIAGLLIFKRRQ